MCIMDFFSNKTVTSILSDKSALTLSVYMNVFFFFFCCFFLLFIRQLFKVTTIKQRSVFFSAYMYLHAAMLKGKNREKTNMLIF